MSKLLFDIIPAIIFFIAFKLYGIYSATVILIVASGLQMAYLWLRYRRVDTMYWLTFVLVLLFGGATVLLHNPIYLKWKVSILNGLFGCLFLASHATKRTVLERFLKGESQTFPRIILVRFNCAWGIFFLFIACLNFFVAYHYSTAVWVNFKVFGVIGLTLVFIILQMLYFWFKTKK